MWLYGGDKAWGRMSLLASPGGPECLMMEIGEKLKRERRGKRGKGKNMRIKEDMGEKERKTGKRDEERIIIII